MKHCCGRGSCPPRLVRIDFELQKGRDHEQEKHAENSCPAVLSGVGAAFVRMRQEQDNEQRICGDGDSVPDGSSRRPDTDGNAGGAHPDGGAFGERALVQRDDRGFPPQRR